MRSFEIPEILFNEFGRGGNKLAVEGFPDCEIVWKDDFPNVTLKIFLEGQAKARQEGWDTDLRIGLSGAGSPWIHTRFELLEYSPFKEIFARAMELYRQSEDYTGFA